MEGTVLGTTWKTGVSLVAVAAVGVLGAWYLWPRSEPAVPGPVSGETVRTRQPEPQRAWPDFSGVLGDAGAPPEQGDGPVQDEVPPALRGVRVIDKALTRLAFDERGRVVANKQTRKALEDAFSRLERPLSARELAGVERAIRRRLTGPAADEVARLVRHYHGYRLALRAHLEEVPAGEAASRRVQFTELVELRRRHLGADVAVGFYADDEAYRRFVLERQRIAGQTGLTRQQRVARQTALQDDLLRGVMHLRSRDSAEADSLRAEMRALREDNASQAFMDFVRTQSLGLAVAGESLTSAEARAEWRQQLAVYRGERRAILDAGLSEADKRAQLEALFERYFGEREKALVEAFRAD